MVPELRPRGIGEMLDAAVSLYRARFRKLMLVAIAVVVPVQILSTIVLLSAQPDGFNTGITGAQTPRYDNPSVQLGATIVVFVVGIISSAFVISVCTRIVADAYVDFSSTTRDAVTVARRRILAVIGVSIIVAISEFVGVLACLVGALVPLAFFAVAVPALILEGVGVSAAIGRSATLVKSNFFRVLGLVVTAQVLSTVVNIGLAAGVALLVRVGGDSTTASVLAQGLANTFAAVITTPFIATATVVLYFDLRIREEAYDVQLLMQRNDTRYAT